MKRYFCDACDEEFAANELNSVAVPCHLYNLKFKNGYVDHKNNRVSGKSDLVDLCNKCSNIFYSAALNAVDLPKQHKED